MSAVSFARGNLPLRRVSASSASGLASYGAAGVGRAMNGRLFFPDCFSLDGRTLLPGTNYQPVEPLTGRIARYKDGVGLQTSTSYPSGDTGWTTHVSEAAIRSGVSPAYAVGLLGVMKLGSTYHFLVVVAGSNNPEMTPWISVIRHVSTTDFTTWSSVTSITDNAASNRYATLAAGLVSGQLYKVGTNLLLPGTFSGDFSDTSMLTSTNGVNWTRRTRNSYTSLHQSYPGARLFDIEASSSPLQSAYTDDGETWTDFELSNSFSTVGNGVYAEGKYILYAQSGSWGLWESRDPATIPFTLSPLSASSVSPDTQPRSLVATPIGLANIYRQSSAAYLRYFV